MTHALAIARREIQERRFVLIAAVAFALIPLLIAALPYGGSAAEKIGTIGGIFAVGFTAGLGATLGSSIVGRDLSSGKLSFYYARPVTAASIWFGKLLGAIVLMLIAFVVTFLPVMFVQRAWFETWNVDLRVFAAVVLGASLVLMLLAHAISTIVRSRSWLVGIDFTLLAVALVSFGLILSPLLLAFAFGTAAVIAESVVLAVVLAIVPSGLWQIAKGRSDRFRSHRALSTFFWASVAVILLVALGASLYVMSAAPEDLVAVDQYGSSVSGSTVIFGGQATARGDYKPMFVGDLASGTYHRAPASMFYEPRISADGTTLLFAEPADVLRQVVASGGFAGRGADPRRIELSVAPASDPDQRRVITRVTMRDDFDISADGRRVAVIGDDGLLSLYDAENRRLLASARLGTGGHEAHWTRVVIPSDNIVRAYVPHRAATSQASDVGPGVVRIFELDAATRTLRSTGEIPFWGRAALVLGTSDGRALVRTFVSQAVIPPPDAPPMVRLVDGRTGATLIAAVPSAPGARSGSTRLLSDGRLAVLENRGGSYFLRVLESGGTVTKEIALGNGASMRIEGEAAKDRLIVGSVGEENSFGASYVKPWSVRTVDLARGAVLHQRTQLRAVGATWGGIGAGAMSPVIPCVDKDRRLVRWNALTNAVEPIAWRKG